MTLFMYVNLLKSKNHTNHGTRQLGSILRCISKKFLYIARVARKRLLSVCLHVWGGMSVIVVCSIRAYLTYYTLLVGGKKR
jgi:hypothetical protein